MLRLNREMYPSITQDPSTLLCKLDNGAFRIEEEEVLGVENGERWVRFLRAVGDFAADGSDEDLFQKNG